MDLCEFHKLPIMKSKIYLLILIAIPLITFSCKKWRPENRIVGSWRLFEMEKKRLFSNDRVITGYESGVFIFNENFTATYTDASGTLTGTWDMRNRNGADGGRTVFIVHLYDFSRNIVLDWYFDDVHFRDSGDKLFAFIDGRSYTYRYDFRKQ